VRVSLLSPPQISGYLTQKKLKRGRLLNFLLSLVTTSQRQTTDFPIGELVILELRPKNWTQKQCFLVNGCASGLLSRPLVLELDWGQVP
jgi:hypothetical protein